MVIADTSIWIDYFNGVDNQYTDALDNGLVEGIIAIGDIIFLEILQGFKSDNDYNLAKKTLSALEQYEMLGQNQVLNAANNYRELRKKGITIRKTNDVIIATFCIENKMPLLFLDKDFKPFVKYLGLIEGLKKI